MKIILSLTTIILFVILNMVLLDYLELEARMDKTMLEFTEKWYFTGCTDAHGTDCGFKAKGNREEMKEFLNGFE